MRKLLIAAVWVLLVCAFYAYFQLFAILGYLK